MILLDGMARSGTSLLARMMAGLLQPQGYAYYYEPFKHPTPAGPYSNWKEMLKRVLGPEDSDQELASYIRTMADGEKDRLFWKEIRLTLKQSWLLAHFPSLRIVHVTRDILGVFSSHRRPSAPDWMDRHRQIWSACAPGWKRQINKLERMGVPHLELLEKIEDRNEIEIYAIVWALNEAFATSLRSDRLLCITYENLCLDPGKIMTRIAKFLEIRVDEKMLSTLIAGMFSSGEDHDPSGPGTGLSPDTMPEIWRQRLAPDEVHQINGVAGQTRVELGYPKIS